MSYISYSFLVEDRCCWDDADVPISGEFDGKKIVTYNISYSYVRIWEEKCEHNWIVQITPKSAQIWCKLLSLWAWTDSIIHSLNEWSWMIVRNSLSEIK